VGWLSRSLVRGEVKPASGIFFAAIGFIVVSGAVGAWLLIKAL